MNVKIRRLLRAVGFVLVFAIIFLTVDRVTGKEIYYDEVWKKIQDEDTDIDVLIMGNSHAYTALNAKALSEALSLNVYIRGSSAQNMTHTLAAFKAVLEYRTPEIVCLEAFSPLLDNDDVMRSEKIGSVYSNLDGVNNIGAKLDGVLHTLDPENIPDGLFQLFRPTSTWDRLEAEEPTETDLHGFVEKLTCTTGTFDVEKFCRKEKELLQSDKSELLPDYNEKALREFLDLAEEKGIRVIVYAAPCTTNYGAKLKELFSICSEYSCVAVTRDFICDMEEIGLTDPSDFYDTGHLSRSGAGKFTAYFADFLSEYVDEDPDWTRVWGYKTESVSEENGIYTYRMENYDPDCLYRFVLRNADNEIILRSKYSEEPVFSCEYNIYDGTGYDLRCAMIPLEDKDIASNSPDMITLHFMQQNTCVLGEN